MASLDARSATPILITSPPEEHHLRRSRISLLAHTAGPNGREAKRCTLLGTGCMEIMTSSTEDALFGQASPRSPHAPGARLHVQKIHHENGTLGLALAFAYLTYIMPISRLTCTDFFHPFTNLFCCSKWHRSAQGHLTEQQRGLIRNVWYSTSVCLRIPGRHRTLRAVCDNVSTGDITFWSLIFRIYGWRRTPNKHWKQLHLRYRKGASSYFWTSQILIQLIPYAGKHAPCQWHCPELAFGLTTDQSARDSGGRRRLGGSTAWHASSFLSTECIVGARNNHDGDVIAQK